MTDASTTSNLDAARAQALDHIFEIGRLEGRGKTARMSLAEYVTARSREGLFTIKDAEEVWTKMMQGSSSETNTLGGDEFKDTKQRASDIKHFIVLGSNKSLDGVEMLDNAKTRMINLRNSGVATGRVWELILAFARAQNKSPERELTDAEIDQIMTNKSADERELADRLWGARNTLLAANEGHDLDPIYQAANLIEKQVEALGGTRKQKKQAAAAKAKAKAEAKKKRVKK